MENPSEITLSLTDEHTSHEHLQTLTTELASDLRRQPGLKPSFPTEQAHAEGSTAFRGDPLAIGKLILELVSSSAFGSLITVIRAWFERKPDLVFELKRNGDTLKITRKEFHAGDEEAILTKIRSFLTE